MIGSNTALPRRIAFLGFNAGALLLTMLFLIAPLVERFSDRADAIAEDSADLVHQQALRARALAMIASPASPDDHFLPGHDEATADADLQQVLKTLAGRSGVQLVGVRGLGAGQHRPTALMVSARLDVEGSMSAIGALVQAIETHAPCLFISALSMRANAAGPAASADSLNVQLNVLGAFQRPALAKEER